MVLFCGEHLVLISRDTLSSKERFSDSEGWGQLQGWLQGRIDSKFFFFFPHILKKYTSWKVSLYFFFSPEKLAHLRLLI